MGVPIDQKIAFQQGGRINSCCCRIAVAQNRSGGRCTNGRGCYDLDIGGTTFRTKSRSFGSVERSETGEMDGVTEEPTVVEYFS